MVKVGQKVSWTIGKGKHKKIFSGKVFDTKPKKAPGSIGVRIGNEDYYTVARLKVKK